MQQAGCNPRNCFHRRDLHESNLPEPVSMPRYFFHVRDGVSKPDPEGVELSERQEAWIMATRLAGEIIRDQAGGQKPGWGLRIDVMEDGWQPCWSLVFQTEAFVPDPRRRPA